jgi:hypothetical protein
MSYAALKAAKEARVATMVAIAKLVDDAAVKNGGRVPKGFVPEVIQKFSRVAPGLTRDQINHYIKKHKRSATTGSELTPGLSPMTMFNNLPQDEADPAKKRQKGGRRKGSTMKSSQTDLEIIKKLLQRLHKTIRMHLTTSQRKQSIVAATIKRESAALKRERSIRSSTMQRKGTTWSTLKFRERQSGVESNEEVLFQPTAALFRR